MSKKQAKNNTKVVDDRNRQLNRQSNLSIIILLVVLIIFNIIFTEFVGPHTRFDWTANQSMTLGDVSRELLQELESPVRIVVLLERTDFPGRHYAQVDFVEGLLEEYDNLGGDDVTVDYIDPELNPNIIETLDPQGQYEGQLLRGRMAVFGTETGKLKILSARDFMNTQMNQQYQQMITGYSAESKISGAINFVSSLETPVVYLSQGHGEAALDDGFTMLKELLSYNNFMIEDLDALSLDKIPEDARFVFMLNPQQDLIDDEVDIYTNYIKTGGNLFVLADFNTTEFSNLNKVLHEFNLELTQDRVVEHDAQKMMDDKGYTFLANTPDSSLGKFGDQAWSISGNARAVTDANNAKEWITVEPLLTTSAQGTLEHAGDPDDMSVSGEQTLAMLSENKGWVDGKHVKRSSKALVAGSSTIFHDAIFKTFLRQSANYPLAVSAMNYLGEMEADRLTIRSKPVVSYALGTQYQSSLNVASIFAWVILPLIFVVIAIVVYRRRKNL